MKKFRAMKFDTKHNEELSERLQKILFDLGYRYLYSNSQTLFSNIRFFFTNEDGILTTSYDKLSFKDGILTPSYDKSSFDREPSEEINISWLVTPVQQKTVKIGNKEYYEDELVEALANIKPIEDK